MQQDAERRFNMISPWGRLVMLASRATSETFVVFPRAPLVYSFQEWARVGLVAPLGAAASVHDCTDLNSIHIHSCMQHTLTADAALEASTPHTLLWKPLHHTRCSRSLYTTHAALEASTPHTLLWKPLHQL